MEHANQGTGVLRGSLSRSAEVTRSVAKGVYFSFERQKHFLVIQTISTHDAATSTRLVSEEAINPDYLEHLLEATSADITRHLAGH